MDKGSPDSTVLYSQIIERTFAFYSQQIDLPSRQNTSAR